VDAIAAINAALVRDRQTLKNLVPRALTQHDPHQIRGVLSAEFVHDTGAVDLDRAWADTEMAASLLVGCTVDALVKHLALAGSEQLSAREGCQAPSVVELPVSHASFAPIRHPGKYA